MKRISFVVNAGKSYFKTWADSHLKPNVPVPLVEPLLPGGKITLAIDEAGGKALGETTDLQFASDRFKADPLYGITGALQVLSIRLGGLNLSFDPNTGQIIGGTGGYGFSAAGSGGAGNVWTNFLGPSVFLDANSPSFDMSDGLGCGGGLVLELGLHPTDNVMGSPGSILVHLDAAVDMEDLDGDGKFEKVCLSPAIGTAVRIGDALESVSILFGVTGGGGGIGILPNGHIIRINPWGPPDPVLNEVSKGLAEVVRGLALRDISKDSGNADARIVAKRTGLQMMEKGLKGMLEAVKKERT